MKLFSILLIILSLFGCTAKPVTNPSAPSPSNSPSISQTPSLNIQDIPVPEGDKVYLGNFEVNHSFDAIGIPPTYIRVIENDTIITWGVEAGFIYNTENNPYGGTFTGVMTEIADHIYAVDGDFFYLDYSGQYDNLVSEDIDFYIILRGNALYGVFEPMSISELEEYVPTDIYKYDKDQ